ncbi:MAG: KpsF/GutQ family sugar-phosphate isomerase [Lachnospiraceae bacterium]|nr:KpsF/GutQ family sugar-phosphate isomerase [Lachnospiraceae bacterium]
MTEQEKILAAKTVFDKEIIALEKMRDELGESFLKILDAVTYCDGKVVFTGIGKAGHVAAKMAATLSSLGTSSFFLHPAEAEHGDLGMVSRNDVVVAVSYSGESDEIIKILPNIRLIGAFLIGITANPESSLAKSCDLVQILPEFEEACILGLAPTSSTTVEMCYGDALAVTASQIYGFGNSDFGMFHPAGSLGKKLVLHVDDVMHFGDDNAIIKKDDLVKDAIFVISKKELGMVNVVDDQDLLLGVITSGDIRRTLERNMDIYEVRCGDIMTTKPYVAKSGTMAVDSLRTMIAHNISSMPVVDKGKLIGTVRISDILRVGIVDNVDFSTKS